MKCLHCGKGDVFSRVVKENGEEMLKCNICSYLNKEDNIFPKKEAKLTEKAMESFGTSSRK